MCLRKTMRGRILGSAVSALFLLMTAEMVKKFAGPEKGGDWATYSHGVLRVVIPYRAAQAGAGRLTVEVEVLDPENHILGQTEESAKVAKGASQFRAECLPLDADARSRLSGTIIGGAGDESAVQDRTSLAFQEFHDLLRLVSLDAHFL